jgi:mono/diheme cytochrome c family protein
MLGCVSKTRTIFLILVGVSACAFGVERTKGVAPPAAERPSPANGARFFETQVRPILQTHCIGCHGGDKVRSGLKLTSRDAVLTGGERGPAVLPERPEKSLLLQAINHRDLKMPPRGKLPQAQLDVLARWVKMGAPWSGAAGTVKRHGPPPVDDKARAFWSFRPVVRPKVPAVRNAGWARTPIDAFILAKLEAVGLQPAPPARKAALLRRVYYDLIGLPPSPEEVADFLADSSPGAYEKVVDRLLASPHHGEKWARHWLDLVRYAETNGYEFDTIKPQAWRYRDYVINSFNADKPYDRFIREQLAGDELVPGSAEGLVATGYYRVGPWDSGAPDRLQARYDELDDIVGTTGQVFLGLTVHCARCHDHKIDPFPQKDYYRLLAFFHGVQRYSPRSSLRSISLPEDQRRQSKEIAQYKKRLANVEAQLRTIENGLAPHLEGGERDDFKEEQNRPDIIRKHVPRHVNQETYDRYRALGRERFALARQRPAGLAQALSVTESGPAPPRTFILRRGDPRSRGEPVEPGFPSVLTSAAPVLPAPGRDATTSGRRRALAEWIASPANPLTPRVIANRIWQHHFGRGIVRSSSDFGYRGTPPTHPELLDWLAGELIAHGWKLKPIHKLIVMSSAYQMSSRPSPAALAKGPENDLFWRFDLRRLTAEELRDSILAVCGNLERARMSGPSIYPTIQREVLAGQSRPGIGWRPSPPAEQARRSIYIHRKRSLTVPLLAAFDTADADSSCPVRFSTTQPTQALAMLNGDFVNDQAAIFAADLRARAGDRPAAQVRLALWRVTQREPSASEVQRGVDLMTRLRNKHAVGPEEALRSFCLLALNLNEFIYLN